MNILVVILIVNVLPTLVIILMVNNTHTGYYTLVIEFFIYIFSTTTHICV